MKVITDEVSLELKYTCADSKKERGIRIILQEGKTENLIETAFETLGRTIINDLKKQGILR